MKQTLKSSAVALALMLGGAVAVTATAPPAHAFGLSDIANAAKGAVKRVAKDAANSAKIVGRGVKNSATYVGRGVKQNAKDFGGALKRDASKIGKGIATNAKDFGRALKRDLKPLKPIGKTIIEVGFIINKCTVGILDGHCRNKFVPPEVKPRPNRPIPEAPDTWDSRKRMSGAARKTRKPYRSQLKNRSLQTTVVRDRSLNGRPVGIPLNGLAPKRQGSKDIVRNANRSDRKFKTRGKFSNRKGRVSRAIGNKRATRKATQDRALLIGKTEGRRKRPQNRNTKRQRKISRDRQARKASRIMRARSKSKARDRFSHDNRMTRKDRRR